MNWLNHVTKFTKTEIEKLQTKQQNLNNKLTKVNEQIATAERILSNAKVVGRTDTYTPFIEDDYAVATAPPKRKYEKFSVTSGRILRVLRNLQTSHTNFLQTATGVRGGVFYKILNVLTKKGRVKKTQRGIYKYVR